MAVRPRAGLPSSSTTCFAVSGRYLQTCGWRDRRCSAAPALGIADLSGFRVGFHFCENGSQITHASIAPRWKGAGVRRRQIDRVMSYSRGPLFQCGNQQVVDVRPLFNPTRLPFRSATLWIADCSGTTIASVFGLAGEVGKVDQIGLRRPGKGRGASPVAARSIPYRRSAPPAFAARRGIRPSVRQCPVFRLSSSVPRYFSSAKIFAF